MPDIMHLIKINVPVEKVYQALTTPEGIRNWWTRDAELDSKIGGEGEFRFGSYGSDGNYVTRVRVVALEPPRHVKWKTTYSFRQEWTDTTIAFDLEAVLEGTMLRFAHRGFPQADDNYALCTSGWGYYLISLQQYLQAGQGAPSPDVDFARVLR